MNTNSMARAFQLPALAMLAVLATVPALGQEGRGNSNDDARERIEQRRGPAPRNESPKFKPPAERSAPAPAPAPAPQAAPPARSAPVPAPQAGRGPRPPPGVDNANRPPDPRAARWGAGPRGPSPPRSLPPPVNNYRALPPGYHRYGYRGSNYYFLNGYWYSPYSSGYRLIRPPFGLVIYDLPPYYSSYWYGGRRYYYANDVYYLWDPTERGYVISGPPQDVDDADDQADDDIFVYPTRGQNEEQQANDRYECHRWAADQTGFDPTQSSGGVAGNQVVSRRADYRRAETACLEGRGYNVR